MFQVSAQLLYNKRIKKNYYEIALMAPKIATSALPGQFVNIKVTDDLEPLLRRPFSIHQIYRQTGIKILYEAIGRGSEALTQRKSGECLDVIGPLGNGFDYGGRRTADDGRRILVAGGMGTAPLVFLAEKLAKTKNLVLLGARTKDDILCEKEFKELGCEVKIATDDGSRGFKGYVSELLKDELSAKRYPCLSGRQALNALYACGPTPMLKEISRISQEYEIPTQISLEAHMACGIGACMGCVIKTKEDEYKRVCKDGPVFEASRVIWEANK